MRKRNVDACEFHRSIVLAVTVFVLMVLFQNVAASVYESLLMQSYTTATAPPVILEAGTAGTGTIYTNNTSSKVSVAAPAPIPTYYPNGYSISTGTYVSGNVPADIQTVDANYLITRSATSTMAYNLSSYSMLGRTAFISGTLSDLQSNNGVYMQFRSYVSASSTTAKTNAFIAYRDSTTTLNTTKERTWTGDTATWGSQSEMPTAGSPIRFARVAYSPIEQRSFEKTVVTLSDEGYLDAYVWMGISWFVTGNIGSVGTTANSYRAFDIEYEKANGRGLLVYSTGGGSVDMQYKIWNGSAWSTAYDLDLTATASGTNIYWITLAQKAFSGANEIALLCIEGSGYVYAKIWDGSSWGNEKAVTSNAITVTPPKEVATIVYEQVSGYAAAIVARGSKDEFLVRWNGSAWETNIATDFAGPSTVYWLTAKADPTSNKIIVATIDTSSDLNTQYWDGSAWAASYVQQGTAVDTNAERCADFDWEPSGSKGLLVWGTTAGKISYKTFTVPDTWGTQTDVTMGTNIHPWVQLRRNPRSVTGDVKILGVVLEATVYGLGAIEWDGTTFTVIGSTTLAINTATIAYESFEIEFQRFGLPTEFTSEVEFSGASNTETWTQLVWNIDSSWTTDSVTVTIQVYNYTLGAYPTSGWGYDGYTSSATANMDETRTQTITTNPTHFRDSSGNWKIKVKGVKTTTNLFDFKADWIEFKPTCYSECTVSTEFLFSSMTTNTPTQLNFTVVSQYDIASVNVTIQVWNYSSSSYVTSSEGYLAYTSAGPNETKLLIINSNPQFYTSAGNAKINVTGVLTTTQYQQEINQVKLDYRYNTSSTYDHVLKVANQVTDAWNVSLKVYDSSNIARLSNATISFHDGTSSDQIMVRDGNITQSEGAFYDLLGSATIYISISKLQASAAGMSYLYVCLKILVPSKSTYSLYIITFEVT